LPAEHSGSAALWEWVQRFVPAQLLDIEPLVADLRRIKDAGEIELLRKATAASLLAHQEAIRELKPGTNERDIAGLMYYTSAKGGCERWAYAPIVGSGLNGTVLHYGANSKPVQSGDLVVIDVACEYSMYASDITRTLPANGKFTARQREIYDVVLGAQQAAIAAFQAGKSTMGKSTPDSLYKIAYDHINSHGKDLHGQPLGKYFIHGLGHFVGLEVHDVGDYKKLLDRGTVFTIEPGIYLPEEKLGVRIEDIFYVDQTGKLVNMTAPLPHTADEIEHAMGHSGAVH
jgi:Xaa-Pro aminopeptidase